MRIIDGIENLGQRRPNVVLTIGNFDGVHRGHQKIFERVVNAARDVRGTAMAISFSPHPVRVLFPERGMKMITSPAEKARLMDQFGIDVLLCIRFSREFANTGPDSFIKEVIVDRIGAKEVIVGHSYAFGKGKKGTTEILRRRGRKWGFGVEVVRSARIFGEIVSSSRIRSLVSRGRVCEASWLLGRPYMIEGTVVRGAGRGGAILKVPTANIDTANELIPKEGVYAVKADVEGLLSDGVANIGRNPTFGNAFISNEVHIFDFSGDILGRHMRIHFIDRIRDEKTFHAADALKDQIFKDIDRAKEVLRTKRYPKVI